MAAHGPCWARLKLPLLLPLAVLKGLALGCAGGLGLALVWACGAVASLITRDICRTYRAVWNTRWAADRVRLCAGRGKRRLPLRAATVRVGLAGCTAATGLYRGTDSRSWSAAGRGRFHDLLAQNLHCALPLHARSCIGPCIKPLALLALPLPLILWPVHMLVAGMAVGECAARHGTAWSAFQNLTTGH